MSLPARANRDGLTDAICVAAEEQGWKVTLTSKSHVRMVPPDKTKPIVVTSGTAGDYRSSRNFLQQARRSGLIYPPPK